MNHAFLTKQELQRICGLRRDPLQPPLDPTPLVDALNLCLNDQNQFDIRVPECAMEFMSQILDNIEILLHYIATHYEVGDCVVCGSHYRQVGVITVSKIHPLHHDQIVHILFSSILSQFCEGLCVPSTLGDCTCARAADDYRKNHDITAVS